MTILAIIPARFASTRFPGKPLADINGRAMILRVCDQAKKAGIFTDILVATDDSRIFECVVTGGYHAVMTSTDHFSGTDRCLEALETWESGHGHSADFVINIQGDEPYIQPEQILKINEILLQAHVGIATLAKLITREDEIFNPNVVKVVFNNESNALYFGRAPLPWLRAAKETTWYTYKAHYKHIGIYGFSAGTLRSVCKLPQGTLEKSESLEQLRWLENGFGIRIGLTEYESIAIDTPEDLLKITNMA